MDLAKEFDAYEFMDQVENPEDALTEIKYNLLAGNGMLEYAAFLKDVKEESRELAPKAEALLGKLKEYSPELTEGIQPMVKIQFSQDLEFKEGSMIPLAEADERLRAADERQADFNSSHQGEARVLIVSYEIIYAEEDQMKKVAGTLKLIYSQYRELQGFAQFGSDLDADTKARLAQGERIVEVLKQDRNSPVAVEKQVAILYATIHGYLKEVAVPDIAEYERRLYTYLDENVTAAGVMETIRTSGDLKPETEEQLKQVLADFTAKFLKEK